MKLDRFWIIQILIAVVLFALLIGSYLLSSRQVSSQTGSSLAQANTTENEEEKPAATATCAPAGIEPSPEAIGASLASKDPARQKSCLAFLQAESQAGDQGAELWLGRAYHNGWGVGKDLTEAAAHYRKAAAADDPAIRESASQWLLQVEKEQ